MSLLLLFLPLTAVLSAQKVREQTSPALPKWTTKSGVDTLLVEKHDSPLITLKIAFPSGGYFDPTGKDGLTNLMGEMLLRGTKKKSRNEIETALEQLGASLSVGIGDHSTVVAATVLHRNLQPLLDLMMEILSEPSFPEDEIKLLRDEIISHIYLRLENDAQLAQHKFTELLYRGHPYGRDLTGTITTLKSITRPEIVEQYKNVIHRGGVLIGAAGDLSKPEFDKLVADLVPRLADGKRKILDIPFVGKPKGREVTIVDKPDRTQAHFLIGQPAISASDSDYFPLLVYANAFAGRMFQAQYLQEIRVKRGWAYGAYGSIDARRDGGSYYLYTYPAVKDTVAALKLSLEMLESAVSGSVPDTKLEFSKKNLARSYPFMIDTPEEVLNSQIFNRMLRRPPDYLENFVAKIEAVTPERARAAAKKHLNSENLQIVVLCSAKELKEKLAEMLKVKSIKVVPFDQL